MQGIKDAFRLKFSKITLLFALFIIVSVTFMRQLVELAQRHIGWSGVKIILAGIMIASSALFLIWVIKKGVHPVRTPAIILVLLTGLVLAWQTKYPVEKIHILEYGALGLLAARDLMKIKGNSPAIILACIFCLLIGFVDELVQAILPYRVYDVRDIAFNSLGSVWGIILYLLARIARLKQ